jgi:hypothetical protein
MIGGDTFGIHDDDAWYCTRGNPDRYCGSQTAISPYPDFSPEFVHPLDISLSS